MDREKYNKKGPRPESEVIKASIGFLTLSNGSEYTTAIRPEHRHAVNPSLGAPPHHP
ncbi:hypothetical protein GCM10022421_27360 [Oceanisphaera sediminis]|uniref:Uncharacterized protein n=1 Tax=Oceanisphaera sediminis TaxID=981381 RepID=A0ABP7EGJ3_9GAMM